MNYVMTAMVVWSLMAMGQHAMAQDAGSQDENAADDPSSPGSLLNFKLPTMGGKQFWTDRHWRQGWRIQHNAVTGHFRLIDASNVRHAWGSQAACEQALDQAVPDKLLKSRRIVLLLHGLGRSSSSMRSLGDALETKTDCQVVYFEYASTRASITEHASALRDVVAGLPTEQELCFVGHSMGNIVLRHAIHDWQEQADQATLARMKSIVMLGPPNQGASIARQLAKTGVFGWITGDGGMELGPNWEEFQAKLATPPCAFGIIAGRLPSYALSNPLVDGQGDFVVSVEEAKLDGSRAMLEVPRMHSFLMDDPAVQASVIAFLDHQAFD